MNIRFSQDRKLRDIMIEKKAIKARDKYFIPIPPELKSHS
jgi:hypothetical protein